MLSVERRKYILDKLKIDGSVKVEPLAIELGVTPMTIRRDLDKLESEDLLKRTHGGAILSTRLFHEEEYDIKKQKNVEVKRKIAHVASELIQENATILLDAGTTVYELANILKYRDDLIIITGDLKIASLLYNTDNEVHIMGGKLEKKTGTIMLNESQGYLDRISIDLAFLGGSAISKSHYLTTPTFDKAELKSKIINVAETSILLVDDSKFNLKSLVKIAHLKEFDVIITDRVFDGELMNGLVEADVKVYQV